MSIRKLAIAVGAVGALVLAGGCSSGSSKGGGNGSTDFGGQTIQLWSSMDQPIIDGLKAKLAPQFSALKINVKWSKIDNINQIIAQKVQANDPPDIALLPQPGIIKDLGTKHKLTALDNILDMNALKNSMAPGTLDVAKGSDGKTYGLMISMNVKGLIFYPKKAFDAAGYTAPTTLQGLLDLTNKIKADGKTPWCLGVEAGTGTGWPATDWLENLVLKYGGTQQYNQWIDHTVKFNSPIVNQAANYFANIAFTQGNVLGGRTAIDSNNFGTAGNQMFTNPPKCMMYMQGSFITGFFPKDVQANLDADVGVFGLPPNTAGGDNPVEGGGDTASIYKDSKAAEKVMQILSATDIGTTAAANGSSFISPHKDFPLATYPLKLTQAIAKVAYDATGFGFDASDAMPGAVGSGSFWKEMTAWISGSESLTQALNNIDQSWPS
jgi:alpha-glucoside transport system substrate-binding protein